MSRVPCCRFCWEEILPEVEPIVVGPALLHPDCWLKVSPDGKQALYDHARKVNKETELVAVRVSGGNR